MGTLKHRKSWLKTIEGRSQVLRSYNKLALKLFIICMTESFADAAEVENFDEEAESGGLAAHDTGVANADPEKIPDSTLDTTPDIDSLTEESFITEDAESAEISEEDSTEQSDEIFADPIEDSYIDDINDTGNEELSGAIISLIRLGTLCFARIFRRIHSLRFVWPQLSDSVKWSLMSALLKTEFRCFYMKRLLTIMEELKTEQ